MHGLILRTGRLPMAINDTRRPGIPLRSGPHCALGTVHRGGIVRCLISYEAWQHGAPSLHPDRFRDRQRPQGDHVLFLFGLRDIRGLLHSQVTALPPRYAPAHTSSHLGPELQRLLCCRLLIAAACDTHPDGALHGHHHERHLHAPASAVAGPVISDDVVRGPCHEGIGGQREGSAGGCQHGGCGACRGARPRVACPLGQRRALGLCVGERLQREGVADGVFQGVGRAWPQKANGTRGYAR